MPTRPPGTPTVDLTFDDTFGTINDAVFMTGLYQPIADHFSSFLEIQHNGTEQGYNTNGTLQYDTKDTHGGTSTHSILLANIPIVVGDGSHGTVEGVTYREFRVNIGEAGTNKQFLSLDALQIWQEESGSLTNFTPGSGFAGAHTNYLAYNLDAGGDHWVGLKEPSNGNGANQTEFTVLIPDSDFINDPSHRYITLYSKFGQQAGWESDSGSEEWGLNGDSTGPTAAMTVHKTAAVPGGTADTVGEVISYAITVANVGDTALTGITVTDSTASNLAPVLSAGFNSGDTNHDNKLSAGETWQYTANHTVTQNDIDSNGGGDGVIENTATADSNETLPVSASALVTVVQNSGIDLVKTADVTSVNAAGNVIHYTVTVENTGTTTLTNMVVTDPSVVNDPILNINDPIVNPNWQVFVQLRDGDFNLGDDNNNGVVEPTDQNNSRDPGETWQYVYLGDTDQNGFHDPGETWTARNLGDTNNDGIHQVGEIWVGDSNQNGVQESGENWQFKNVWDTNHNGLQDGGEVWHYQNLGDNNQNGVQDPGETFEYYNAGDTNQNGNPDPGETFQYYNAGDTNHNGVQDPGETFQFSHVLPGVDANHDNFNDGDANHDGQVNPGETWQFAASYTITQNDIDNRNGSGVPTFDPALARDNTASVSTSEGVSDSDSWSVAIDQNPHLTLVKSASVADGTADADGDVINYTINVTNDGNMTLTSPAVSDPSVSMLAPVLSGGFNAGDANHDGELDLGETWQYTAHHTVTQDDIDNGGVVASPGPLTYNNTASVTTSQSASGSDSASVVIVQNPHVVLDKTATVPGGTADTAGEVITYAITIHNDGNMTLTNPVVSDPSVSDLAPVLSGGFNAGDIDHDAKLDLGETWQYSASHTVTQSDLDTNGGGDGVIQNTASVSTDQGASSSDSASVTVVPPPAPAALFLDKSDAVGTHFVDSDEDGHADVGTDLIQYAFQITNTGGVVLHDVTIDDSLFGGTIYGPEVLDPGETFTFTLNHFLTADDVAAGHVANDATATGLDPSSNVVSVMAHYNQLLPA
jgi:uncharacterized repeat protein (TIGR01451 family)